MCSFTKDTTPPSYRYRLNTEKNLLRVQSIWSRHTVTVGGLQLSWLPIRTSASCKERRPPQVRIRQRGRRRRRKRERETGRKRKEKLRENNKVLQLHSLKRRKELILLFCPHVRVSQEVVRHLKYVKTRIARFSSSFIIISVLSVELWDVLFLQDFQYSKVSNWKSEHSTFS